MHGSCLLNSSTTDHTHVPREQLHDSVVDDMHIAVLGCQEGSMHDVLRVLELGLVTNRIHMFDEVLQLSVGMLISSRMLM